VSKSSSCRYKFPGKPISKRAEYSLTMDMNEPSQNRQQSIKRRNKNYFKVTRHQSTLSIGKDGHPKKKEVEKGGKKSKKKNAAGAGTDTDYWGGQFGSEAWRQREKKGGRKKGPGGGRRWRTNPPRKEDIVFEAVFGGLGPSDKQAVSEGSSHLGSFGVNPAQLAEIGEVGGGQKNAGIKKKGKNLSPEKIMGQTELHGERGPGHAGGG